MQVVERDAIVLNNADPLGMGRVQVFIYGVHDITGSKIPFDNLPWAYSTQSVNMVSIPEVWTPLRVRYRFTFGKSIHSAFSAQDALEWHSPSPYLKITENRDPRKFLIFDSTEHKFLNEIPVNYKAINNRITSLEEQKIEKEGIRENIKIEFDNLTEKENKISIENQEYDSINSLTEISQQINQEEYSYNLESNRLKEKLISGKKYAEITYANRGSDLSDLSLEQYISYINQDTNNSLLELNSKHSSRMSELDSELNSTSTRVQRNTALLETVRKQKESLQQELNAVSQEIISIDAELADLKSRSSNAPKAMKSFEEVKALDSRIGTFDENSGKVFDTSGNLIGNWNGQIFFLPGYALNPGTPIPERIQNRLIKPESYITAVNNNGSSNNNVSTIITPSDSIAIKKSDNDKTWNCDISYETRIKILTKRQSVANAIKWLRDQISSLFSIESNSAVAQWAKAAVKQLTAMLKSVQKFLKFVNNVILEIAKLTAQVRQLINWILSLPARLLVLLQDCLTHFFATISSAFSQSVNVSGTEGSTITFTEINELVNQAQSTFKTATETVEGTVIVYTEIQSIKATFEKA